jgi:hypothetical protein
LAETAIHLGFGVMNARLKLLRQEIEEKESLGAFGGDGNKLALVDKGQQDAVTLH